MSHQIFFPQLFIFLRDAIHDFRKMDMQCGGLGLSLTFKPLLTPPPPPPYFLYLSCSLITIPVAPPKNHRIPVCHMSASPSLKKNNISHFFEEDFITQSPYGQTVSAQLYLALLKQAGPGLCLHITSRFICHADVSVVRKI